MDRRVTQALLVAAVICPVYGLMAGKIDKAPREVTNFWVRKMRLSGVADVVFIGDSRVNRGISPAVAQEVLPGLRIENFGFSGQGVTQPYLDRARTVVDPNSKVRALVIGVTPRMFTAAAIKLSEYDKWAKMREVDYYLQDIGSGVNYFFTPEDPVKLFGRALSSSAPRYTQWFEPGGWMPATRSTFDTKSAEAEYRTHFARGGALPEAIDRLVAFVAHAKADGFKVFLFRPPISPQVRAIEDEMGQFDEAALRSRVEAAGAVWLPTRQGAYQTFDGHHLDRSAAETFTRDLATELKPYLSTR
ncbi:hypothetical protein [Fimbriimonas ginsengisoli]|uniref:SGNH hydrolase-type esterase domain-containing protein n=1 Tax=Fimbriimonas ginsengisoli Gsoil 348 TaxID=661478 RepID=A0A068NT83_FIMGI|nr:hypothetical protein [Fimbriimonas ginsengisoli]AIE86626.1 hypothetical protein OP10G_3258 [Fimbriimonas ginsengisoli Gsoil 348]